MVKTNNYGVYLLNEDRERIRREKIEDRDKFLEKANLSTTKDEEWDTEVWITPIEAEVSKECTTISEKREKKERYFGKREHIEKILEELKR